MKIASIEVKRLAIPVHLIAALTDEQRHFYYLFGLIYNESICLRKLISFSLQTHKDDQYFRSNSEMSQTFFLFRVACSKVWEARLRLHDVEVYRVLEHDVFTLWSGGRQQLKELNRISGETWISEMRNKVGFHYPSLNNWQKSIKPNAEWKDDEIFLGTDPGNLYFDAPEQIIREQMFGPVAASTTATQQMEKRVQQMVKLLVQLNEFVEQALAMFLGAHLVPTGEASMVGRVAVPHLDEVSIPFWTRERLSSRSKRRN